MFNFNNAERPNTAPEDGPGDDYSNLALEFLRGLVRGRSGYGALRHYDKILHQTTRAVFESNNFAPLPPDPVCNLRYFGLREGSCHRELFEGYLATPQCYEPRALWALFWALAEAEHEFLFRFVPFWSHEERLTGHLVAQMIERFEKFGRHWRALDREGASDCRVWYADTAAARREALTGADLGLVIHGQLAGREEFIKVVRLQAKKVDRNGHATIDLDQAEALCQPDDVGYYLFYHRLARNKWSLPPTVRAASSFSSQLTEAKAKKQKTVKLDVRDDGYDLAVFVTFLVADAASDTAAGALADDPEDAVRLLMAGKKTENLQPLTRVAVITLGGLGDTVDWKGLMKKYIDEPRQNED